MNKIVVVDYGMGNLRSVAQALRHETRPSLPTRILQAMRLVEPKANILISGDVADIKSADRLVLPGQGAIPDCMRCLRESGLHDAVVEAARSKPLLGVCLGEQLLFDWSEEGDTPGLGLLPGKVVRFQLDGKLQEDGSRFKVPHMGWNRVKQTVSHPMWQGIADDSYFYFVHSYYVVPTNPAHTAGETSYGAPFACAVARDNIFAAQFHPEKSAAAGLRLYKNFVDWNP